jgi:3,4-dihydroxy 2-butanone 4-phosphate synthase/GTP cyclohydrolase II
MLGHQADNRNYVMAALILEEIGVDSIRLLTNNPRKIEEIREHGISVKARIPIQAGVNDENLKYLETKANKMRHMLDLDLMAMPKAGSAKGRPFVTLSYAQSLDGSIAARRGEPLLLSGSESMMMTHRLRSEHDAILVGIQTVLADDPLLTVRLVEGKNPVPIILDSHLRFPVRARLLQSGATPRIATLEDTSETRVSMLEQAGAKILRLPANAHNRVELGSLLQLLLEEGFQSVMVEGGAGVITSFLAEGLVDRLALTIAPDIIGGVTAIDSAMLNGAPKFPQLKRPTFKQLGNDILVFGDFVTE